MSGPWPSLPRTRGDRPEQMATALLNTTSPPHTRGSSPLARSSAAWGCVSPAHAGIVLVPSSRPLCLPGLPRTRGDRPRSTSTGMTGRPSPPHTRGSSDRSSGCRDRPKVSPAHAGIVPVVLTGLGFGPGLPRTRGDRPQGRKGKPLQARSPPHTRGSSEWVHRLENPAAVSPAHAGIVLRASELQRVQHSLPRTRGDRPLRWAFRIHDGPSPPHTRGSSHRLVLVAWGLLRRKPRRRKPRQ